MIALRIHVKIQVHATMESIVLNALVPLDSLDQHVPQVR